MDRTFEEMRKLVAQFETYKKAFDRNLQSGQYAVSALEKYQLVKFFGPIEYVFRRLGRVISMFMVLAQKFTMMQAYQARRLRPQLSGENVRVGSSDSEMHKKQDSSKSSAYSKQTLLSNSSSTTDSAN